MTLDTKHSPASGQRSYTQGGLRLDSPTWYQETPVTSFLNSLRSDVLARGSRLNGMLAADSERDLRIENCVRSHPTPLFLEGKRGEFEEVARLLLFKFERACHRTGRLIEDQQVTRAVYSHLLEQLSINIDFFKFKKSKILVNPTLMTPVPLTSLPEIVRSMGIGGERTLLCRAFSSHSQDVLGFLKQGVERLTQINQLASANSAMSVPEHLRKFIAFYRMPQDVRELLQGHIDTVSHILDTKPYSVLFQGRRSIVETVVTRFGPDETTKKLRELHRIVEHLACDPDLKVFRNRRAAILYAALGHFCYDKAKDQLQRAYALERRLQRLHGRNNLPCDMKVIRDLCLKSYDSANGMAERLSLG